MKKLIALLSIVCVFTFVSINVYAQESTSTTQESTATVQQPVADNTASEDAPAVKESFHQVLKTKFIEGGVEWMIPILICLIFGLALVIERVIYLNMATTNTTTLLKNVESTIKTGGIGAAKELCRDTRGPVASIFFQGLDRFDEGLEGVEKSIVSYGGVQMARLERNMSWISLFIALAPMLGFLGTVVGMVLAFDEIEKAGDISPTVVAGGMKVALLTTVFGLIVAIILQICYNYLAAKIESLVSDMEDATISFMDILVKNNK